MKSELLLEAIGEIDDDIIMEARTEARHAARRRLVWAGVAACLCLIAVAVALWGHSSGRLEKQSTEFLSDLSEIVFTEKDTAFSYSGHLSPVPYPCSSEGMSIEELEALFSTEIFPEEEKVLGRSLKYFNADESWVEYSVEALIEGSVLNVTISMQAYPEFMFEQGQLLSADTIYEYDGVSIAACKDRNMHIIGFQVNGVGYLIMHRDAEAVVQVAKRMIASPVLSD